MNFSCAGGAELHDTDSAAVEASDSAASESVSFTVETGARRADRFPRLSAAIAFFALALIEMPPDSIGLQVQLSHTALSTRNAGGRVEDLPLTPAQLGALYDAFVELQTTLRDRFHVWDKVTRFNSILCFWPFFCKFRCFWFVQFSRYK